MSSNDPVRPRYNDAWIGAVIDAVSDTVPPPWLPEPAATASAVVVLVVDGLGWNMVQSNAEIVPTIRSMVGGPITAAVPTTTGTGLPSITLGVPPAEHGLMGYRIGLDQGVLNVLRWRFDGGRPGPDGAAFQPLPAFSGNRIPTIIRSMFATSGFTSAHLGGGKIDGYETSAVLRVNVAAAVHSGARVTYAYYDGVDKVAHKHGLHTPQFLTELSDTDRLVRELLQLIPEDTALVITADHGHVEVGPDQMISLDPVAGLVRRMAGESRFRSLYAKNNQADQLAAECVDRWGDVSWVFTREQLREEGWFGDGPDEHFRRVGDVVLAPFEPVGFSDPTTPGENQMVSRHGSLTADEVLVPLIAQYGSA